MANFDEDIRRITGSRFKDSTDITYTEIKENEHCKGTITLTASEA